MGDRGKWVLRWNEGEFKLVGKSEHPDLKILIVDDDLTVLNVLKHSILSFGYTCETATSGLEAVDKLKEQEFDIVVTDVVMPEMDGIQLLSHIKDHYPHTDVIVITGYVDRVSYSDLIRAGAIDFIRKPFERDELRAKLNRVERERGMIRELERLSLHDCLTGLLNRRSFDLKFMEEVQRAHRQDYQVFLALLDVDNFKGYNDTFGHTAGDKLLIALGIILNVCTRRHVDFNFRYGGDEFATILTQTSHEQAVTIMKRVLAGYHQAGFPNTGLSVGLVCCRRDENLSWQGNVISMLDRADQTLYEAKFSGKDKIVVGT